MIQGMEHPPSEMTAQVAVEFRMTMAQRLALRAEAAELGLSAQELLEQKVFGEIRPRKRPMRRSDARTGQVQLPLTA